MSYDIKFDKYGDIEFFNNDIKLIEGEIDVLYQNVVDRLKTNFGDYKLNINFGANLNSFIGKKNGSELESLISKSIIKSLTYDDYLKPSQVNAIAISEQEKVYVRISIYPDNNSYTVNDEFTINTIFDIASGLFYVTD